MTDKTDSYRVTITGPEKAREQFRAVLNDLRGEGARSGLTITIERVTKPDGEVSFSTGNDHE